MFSEIFIHNFKPFGTEQRVRLAPITLIYGPNSAGKSSLIQSLLMLKQSVESRTPNSSSALITQGEYTNLGTFRSLIHKHEGDRELGIGVKIEGERGNYISNVSVETFYQEMGAGEHCYLSKVKYSKEIDGIPYSISLEKMDDAIDSEEDSVFSRAEFRINEEDGSIQDAMNWLRAVIDKMSKKQKETRLRGNTDLIVEEDFQEATFLQDYFLPYIIKEKNTLNRSPLSLNFHYLFKTIPSSYYRAFSELKYLGPLRLQPSRQYTMGETSSVGIRGENSPHIIYQGGKKTTSHINKWFKQFEMPYELEAKSIGDDTTGAIITLTLTDKRTSTKVATTDVGFGVGQIMPILVEGLISQEKVICVEQPEIHLHPRLQAHLGDFFIETATKKNRATQWILETHSETLMLRLQRRIRQKKIKPEDVSVLYVNPVKDEGSVIMELELDEQGRFLDEWPDGFFEEGYREMYEEGK